MAYCNLDNLRKFSGVVADDDLQTSFIESAFDIINSYIGYNALYGTFIDIVDGTGKNFIFLKRPNIKKITSVEIDGKNIDCSKYKVSHSTLFLEEIISRGIKNVVIEYEAGFSIDEIPAIFRQVNIEIANLIQTMSDNNIGITSKSSSIDGSRTFLNNTNYDRYLQHLSIYKL